MVNLVQPEAEAVNKSPIPLLLATKPANEVVPETEATAKVPEFPRTSRVVNGKVVPIPTLPLESIVCLTTLLVEKYTGAAFDVPKAINEAGFNAAALLNIRIPLDRLLSPSLEPDIVLPANAKVKNE